jgi:dienelactone hydrolase
MARALLPRYNKEAAQLAWDRTMAFFKANLA